MKVFITRNLTSDSPIYTRLSGQNIDIIGESLINFRPIPCALLPEADWFFFYSKNGVRFCYEQFKNQFDNKLYTAKIGTIGKGTGRYCEEYGIVPDYVGEGKPDLVANSFGKIAQNQTVAFFRALISKQSVQKQLAETINIIDIPIYENEIRQNIQLPDVDILVFTSSMNVEAYFMNGGAINCQQKVVSIGRPTQKTLKKYGVEEIFLAKEPTINALADEVIGFLK